jgi:nucleotide-binding universal stress UspA family protein
MSHPLRRILLATDGSEDARLAARAAASLSGKAGAELHVVHVWQSVPHPVIDRDYYEEGARKILEAETSLVSGTVTGAHLAEGAPVDEILDLAAKIPVDLVVVGSRGNGPIGRLVLGSVSEAVVHHATCPVLVVRGEAWPPWRVVIGDDGSRAAKKAGELALRIASLYGAGSTLVRAYPELPEADPVTRAADPRAVDDALRRAERDLHERAEELGRHFERPPRIGLAAGDAAVALIQEAHDGEEALIAVGSRGLGPARRLTLGSVSTRVIRAAVGPVLVFPDAG